MNALKSIRLPRIVKLGLPLIIFLVAGSLGLTEFTELKIRQKDEQNRKLSSEEVKAYTSKRRNKSVSLEDVLEKVQKDVNIEEWENKRGPRPWEEDFGNEKTS